MTQRTLKNQQLSKLLGVHISTLKRWRALGLPFSQVGTQPRYNMDEVQAWRTEKGYLRTETKPADASDDGDEFQATEVDRRTDMAKMRIAEARAEAEELALAVQRGELVQRGEVLKGWLMRIQLVKQRLLAVGPRKCRQWAAIRDTSKLLSKITQEMKLVCREFAGGLEEARVKLEKPVPAKKRGRGRPKGSKTKPRKGRGKKA